jgi:FlaA1/EpsC-like NDP-sugar epimerase
MEKPQKLPTIRNRYFLFLDLALIPAGAIFSFLLRLDVDGWQTYARSMLVYATLALLVKPSVYCIFGLYRRFWRYASSRELVSIVMAASLGTVVVMGATLWPAPHLIEFRPVPRSIPFIDWLVSLAVLGGPRFAVRVLADLWHRVPHINGASGSEGEQLRVLVMGAGDAGAMMVREIVANPQLGLVPVGLVDDDPAKQGMVIHSLPVLGMREDIPRLLRERGIDEVIIAMPTARGQAIREVVEICQQTGVAYKTMPGMYELISGQVTVTELRDVQIEDLLRRDPVQVKSKDAARYLEDKVVLVTGAGGSIGSELCRQIATHQPAGLLLLGHGENSIHEIQLELQARFPGVDLETLITDIRHSDHLCQVVDSARPDIIFHAAAHKHVHLMESNVAEAVANNVFGTEALLRAAERCDVDRFVFVSTDKAVNPASVMGATKRLGELLVQDAEARTGGNYIAVRFGNVLGSRGSVVPLFRRQIRAGGPVTVTHPKVERYFMTIPEAVHLVLQAMALGKGGEVFVLDMGEPLRVVDLATDLISLCGLKLGEDIEIAFTGLRPGEKMSEELFAEGEEPRATGQKGILVAYGNSNWSSADLASQLEDLRQVCSRGDPHKVRAKLQDILPEYRPVP